MDSIKINNKNTYMVAHRGLSGIEKENTLAAFIAAGNRSYYGIETDVHKTKDGKFIIIHDSDTSRVSGESYIVEQTDYDVLRAIKLKDIDGTKGRGDLCLPSLEEYLRICKKYDKKCILELKEDMAEADVVSIVKICEAEGYVDNVIFISFSLNNLKYLRKNFPTYAAQYLFGEFNDNVWNALIDYKLDIDVYEGYLTKEAVEKAHSLGIKVNCWTVDNPQNAEKYVEYGVDFITSNILE